MADMDTPDKRRSAMAIYLASFVAADPDGTLDQADRQHIAQAYRGILAAAPPVPPSVDSYLAIALGV